MKCRIGRECERFVDVIYKLRTSEPLFEPCEIVAADVPGPSSLWLPWPPLDWLSYSVSGGETKHPAESLGVRPPENWAHVQDLAL